MSSQEENNSSPEQSHQSSEAPNINSPAYIDSIIKDFSLESAFGATKATQQSSESVPQDQPPSQAPAQNQTNTQGTAEQPGTSKEEVSSANTLVASQIAILAEREARLRAQEQEIANLRPQLETELRSQAAKDIVGALVRDPYGFASTHGLDGKAVEQLAMDFYAMALGEAAPEELKRRTSRNETERLRTEFDQKVANLQRQQEQARLQAYALQVKAGYDGYVSAVDSSRFPYLANEVSDDRNAVVDAFMQVADMHYSRTGVAPDAATVAAQLEANLAATAAKFNRVLQKSSGTVNHQQSAPVTQTRQPPISTISDQLAGSTPREMHPADPYADAESRVQEVLAMLGETPARR